jgi:AraC family transcriptional regulator
METITLRIKNMVCPRCLKVVREDMERLGLEVMQVELGEAVVKNNKGPVDLLLIRDTLRSEGFDLLEDKQAMVLEKTRQRPFS